MSLGHSRPIAEPGAGEIDLTQIAAALSRRRRFVLGATLAALLGALVFVNVAKPRYTAEARVLLENQESYLTRPDKGERAESATAPDAEAVQSQIQLMTSRDLARRALEALDLRGNPEFDPLADGPGLLTRIRVFLGLARDPTKLTPEDRMLEAYFDRLTVLSPTKTRVLQVEFSARDPDIAARAANTIATLYIDLQREAKRDNARSAAQSLKPHVVELRRRVAEAEARAEEFRARSGLLAGANNATIATQQLGDIANQLSISRTAKADAEAKAKLVRDMLRKNRVSEIPDVANNELIRRIGERRVALRGQLALESRTLLSAHPRIKELTAQLADLDADLRRAAERTARTLENEAQIAAARVENLAQAVEAQKRVVASAGADEVRLRELERAARLLKDELEADTAKFQEAQAREGAKATPADARVIQRALAPQMPSFPKKLPITAFATIAALVFSAGSVVAIELLSGRARLPAASDAPPAEDERRIEPAPLVGFAEAERVIPSPPGHAFVLEEATEFSPSLAPTLENVGDVSPRATPSSVVGRIDAARMSSLCVKVLLVGCADAAGNVQTALELARALTRRGRAILLAADAEDDDYDRLVEASERARPLGFADVAGGAASFAEAIHRDAHSRLHVMPAGRAASSPEGADAEAVLDALAQTYDFVVCATRFYERALVLAPVFDIVFVGGEESVAETVRQALERAGVDEALRLEDESLPDMSAA
jgi:uncharacterized protein involved in exopolysaccharide biosynthesis